MKKIAVIIFLCHIVGFSIFFGVRQLVASKKTVNLSVAELAEEKNNADEVRLQGDVESAQKPVGDSQGASVSADQQISADDKQEDKTMESKIPEKTPEKKVDDPKKEETKGEVGKIVSKLISWGHANSSSRKIDTVIVHTSYNSLGGDVYDADKIIGIYKQYDVSAHYLILRDGVIYQLVSDQNISWHAGVSEMPDGRKNVNDFSIGIEVVNTKDGKFTEQQYSALNSLISSLKKKYEIKDVLGHDDIAPGRKTDPWGMDWGKVNR